MSLSEHEALEALALAAPGKAPENARTAEELARASGFQATAIRDRIRKLHLEGRVVVHHVQRPRVDGQMQRVPAYTFLPAKKR